MPRLKDFGKFLCIQGTVLRTTQVHILEFQRELTCTKCGHGFLVKGEFEQFYTIQAPSQCPNPVNCRQAEIECLYH